MSNKNEIWYKVDHYYNCTITPVEVIKETEKTVLYINTRWNKDGLEERAGKSTTDHSFFKTLDEAKEKANRWLDRVVLNAERKIVNANAERNIIEDM